MSSEAKLPPTTAALRVNDAVRNRLRWRCRRGMRELDQLLGWYLEVRYEKVDDAAKAAFTALLEQQDPQLWTWLSGQIAPTQADWCSIIDEIRSRDRV